MVMLMLEWGIHDIEDNIKGVYILFTLYENFSVNGLKTCQHDTIPGSQRHRRKKPTPCRMIALKTSKSQGG